MEELDFKNEQTAVTKWQVFNALSLTNNVKQYYFKVDIIQCSFFLIVTVCVN